MQQITRAELSRNPAHPYITQSEDCLYLNVYAPKLALDPELKKTLPVLVLIHGGGRTRGAASRIAADIAALNQRGILVVTPQYRLGVFSFFAHPDLSEESPLGVSGNYGTLDLVAALRWVQANIASFGGDKNSITVSGPSGGGTATGVLLITPLARALFHRAAPLCSNAGVARVHKLKATTLDQPSAESLGVKFAGRLGAHSLADLRAITARDLQQHVFATAAATYVPPAGAADVDDGVVVPGSIFDLHRRGARHDVPVMLGFNADELSVFHGAGLIPDIPATADDYRQTIKERYGALSKDYLRHYPASALTPSVYAAARDRVVAYGTETVARFSGNLSSPTFLYYMAHQPPSADQPVVGTSRRQGVSHCTDSMYLYGSVMRESAEGVPTPPADQELARRMFDYFVQFVKTGNPNKKSLPRWRAYGSGARRYMRFEAGKARSARNLFPGTWKLWEQIRQQDADLGQFRSWYGGWAADDALVEMKISP